MRPVGRLAPTPSGHLHLGNVCAFACAWLSVRAAHGTLLLRIEDVDQGRARQDIADSQRHDLTWLGLTWDEEVTPQAQRSYDEVLDALRTHTYACRCTRREIREAGGVHPSTCRALGHTTGARRFALPPGEVSFDDRAQGRRTVDPTAFGDPVLVQRNGAPTYNLAVVADDIRDGVTEVVRGADLLDYTAVQIRLYEALGAPTPSWLHAPLILGPDGRKLSKSTGSLEIRALRAEGWRPHDVWRVVLPWLGLEGRQDLNEAVTAFRPAAVPSGPFQQGPLPPNT